MVEKQQIARDRASRGHPPGTITFTRSATMTATTSGGSCGFGEGQARRAGRVVRAFSPVSNSPTVSSASWNAAFCIIDVGDRDVRRLNSFCSCKNSALSTVVTHGEHRPMQRKRRGGRQQHQSIPTSSRPACVQARKSGSAITHHRLTHISQHGTTRRWPGDSGQS